MGVLKRMGGVLLLLAVLLLVSCSSASPHYFAYAESEFRAELRGTLHGCVFSALIEQRADPEDPAGEPLLLVEYLSPSELEGITVRASRDISDATASASLGELTLTVARESVGGWLLPADLLLSLPTLPIERVERQEDGFLLTLGEGILLRVDEEGMPLSLQSEQITFEVVWLEPIS